MLLSKLIKNEFIKLFKKKSTYIILFITIAYIIFSNFMYKNNNYYSYGDYSASSISYYEEELKKLDPKNPSDFSLYVDTKTQVDLLGLMNKYGFESWQSNIISEYLTEPVRQINIYNYSNEQDEKAYRKAKAKYDDVIKKLDSGDWKSFVTEDLEELDKEIEAQETLLKNTVDKAELANINQLLASLRVDKQVAQWRLDKNISFANSFLNSALGKYSNAQYAIYDYEHKSNPTYEEKLEYYDNIETANINEYYIENNIEIKNPDDNRGILLNLFDNYELFILIFIIMIAGSIVSDEFSKGTIKLLLVKPYSRTKILLSKFIVCILVLLLFVIFLTAVQYVIGGIIQGFDSMTIPAVLYNHSTGQIETMSAFQSLALDTLGKLPIYLLLMTLAFACSTLFTNTAIAITLPLLGYMASSIINQLILYYDIKPLLYFVTPNWDLSVYLFGGLPAFEGLTLAFSIAICIAYFIIMLIPTWLVFKKRNIKNI